MVEKAFRHESEQPSKLEHLELLSRPHFLQRNKHPQSIVYCYLSIGSRGSKDTGGLILSPLEEERSACDSETGTGR